MSTPATNSSVKIRRVVGNREAIGATLLDNNGNALNLTGKSIKFRMVHETGSSKGTVKVNNATATIDTAASGQVSYTPDAADVDTAGLFACYFIDDDTIDRLFPYDGANLLLEIVAETSRI